MIPAALVFVTVALLAIVARHKIDRYVATRRAAKARQQAAEDQAIEAYFAPLRRDHDDYLASLSLGFTEDPDAFATRIAAIPAQTRKEA